jgi:hypothetical protein
MRLPGPLWRDEAVTKDAIGLASARAGLSYGPDAARDRIASLLPGILRSQDASEGLRSFIERREARFTGH